MFESILHLRITDILDIVVVTLFVWGGLAWLRRSRARFALLGLAILAAVYLVARQLELQLTAWILQAFFAVFVIVVVVVFQEDLRRLFERIALWGLRRRPGRISETALETLVRAVASLAAQRTGALLVLPGRDPLDRHLEGGTELDGRISEPLLLSVFDPGSPGHDGAVVLQGERVRAFGAHLPLSVDHRQIREKGTRHAAALGLAERSDSLTIVVSEETGSTSVARAGTLRTFPGPDDLTVELEGFLQDLAPRAGRRRSLLDHVLAGWRDGLLSLVIAAVLWVALVPGAATVEMQRLAPVMVKNLPAEYSLVGVDPAAVEVTASGRRRDFLLSERAAFEVDIDAFLVGLGRRTFEISPADVRGPKGVSILSVDPTRVRLSVKPAEAR